MVGGDRSAAGRVEAELHKLYDALETGKLNVEDLAPRIKELKAQADEVEGKRIDLMESIREAKVDLLEASVVRAYVDDPKALLSKGPSWSKSPSSAPSSSASRRTCRRWSSPTPCP